MDEQNELEKLRVSLAEQIKKLRARKGLSQEDLALAADVDRSYVSQLERGIANPTLTILLRIAGALGTKIDLTIRDWE